MKKLLLGIACVILFASSQVMANGKINKEHLNMTGKDKAKINCVYCHTTAKIPKKAGQDKAALYKTPSCAGKGCHK
jgi:uncharacterized GH25 family protein